MSPAVAFLLGMAAGVFLCGAFVFLALTRADEAIKERTDEY